MTYRELNGCTGTWKGVPAVIASEGEGSELYILQNHTQGAQCSLRLKEKYPQFKYSYSLCITHRDARIVCSEELMGFVLDPVQGMLTWKSVKKFSL